MSVHPICRACSISAGPLAHLADLHIFPTTCRWYYDFGLNYGGMGPVIDIATASTAPGQVTTIVVQYATPTPSVQAMSGVYGSILHAVWAKLNIDLDRSTPGSNSDGPAYLSVLASTGDALSYLAGTDTATFASTIAGIPTLLQNAIADVQSDKSPRVPYSIALLNCSNI